MTKSIFDDYFILPRNLFYGDFYDISNDARIMYMLLFDKIRQECKKSGYQPQDNIFIELSRYDLAEMMGCHVSTALKFLRELESVELILRAKISTKKIHRIYLKNI